MRLPRASVPIALASAVSLAAQILFSLLMLRLFAPQAVGEFSVISQIAFFWMTLALAQSPIKLLADVHQPPVPAVRAALAASLLRMALLAPFIGIGVLFSGLMQSGQVLAWAVVLALLQMAWYLAQPLSLRIASSRSSALARALPPLIALLVAAVVGSCWPQAGSNSLLLAAASGYAAGALWLLPASKAVVESAAIAAPPAVAGQADQRSAGLRLAHTTADALTGVALLLLWQRSHGAAEAGYLAVLLRVLGFVPTLIHAAWAQVLLAQGTHRHVSPFWVGLAGALVTGMMGLACVLALQLQWLAPSWVPLQPYVLPMVLWQAAACLLAACSHLPFQRARAGMFSYAAIGFDGMQLLLLGAPLVLGHEVAAVTHVWWLAGLSAIGLLALSFLMTRPERPL